MSHPTRDVWVEIYVSEFNQCLNSSHPTRDVWVEILRSYRAALEAQVTSHTGCVSRNSTATSIRFDSFVTSHTGCVSRNLSHLFFSALRKSHPTRDVWVEIWDFCIKEDNLLSHPTRDVWVEIQHRERQKGGGNRVTSHTGCVSRNVTNGEEKDANIVTSHTGCVSRNFQWNHLFPAIYSHIPHGMCE